MIQLGKPARTLTALASTALLLGLSACGGGSDDGASGGAETLVIGHLAELTGAGASVGIPQSNAIKLAAKQINSDGGFTVAGNKYTIDLKSEDDKSEASAGVAAVQKLRSAGAKYMVGTVSSAVLGAYLPLIQDDENFISVVVGAAAVGVTDNISIYRPRVTLSQYTSATVGWMADNSVKSIAMLSDSQHAGYVAETEPFKKQLAAKGITIKAEESYKLGATDFSAQLTSAIKSSADVLNVRGFPADAARAIKQARELGYDGRIVSNSGMGTSEVKDAQAASAMNDVIDIVAPVTSDLLDDPTYGPAATAFDKAYEDEFGEKPGFTSASAYTGLRVLVAAFEKAGTVDDVAKVRDALDALTVDDLGDGLVDAVEPGPGGLIFTNHQAAYQMAVRTFVDGDFKATELIAAG